MSIDAEILSRFAYIYARRIGHDAGHWPFQNLFLSNYISAEKLADASLLYADLKEGESAVLLITGADSETGLLLTDLHIHYSLPYSAAESSLVKGCTPIANINQLEFLKENADIDVNLNSMHLGIFANMQDDEITAVKTFFRKLFAKEVGLLSDWGQPVSEPAADAEVLSHDDPKVIEKLVAFDRHHQVYCLQCGYDGLMGVEKKCLPWYLTWWVIAPMLISTVSLVPGIMLWQKRPMALRFHVICPNCSSALETR